MSVIRYTLQVLEDKFTETDTFIYVKDLDAAKALLDKLIVNRLREDRKRLGEPPIELVNVEILNPFLHTHDWRDVSADKYALKHHCQCARCRITGYRKIHVMRGRMEEVIRNESYQHKRYELCRDPLTPMPKEFKL